MKYESSIILLPAKAKSDGLQMVDEQSGLYVALCFAGTFALLCETHKIYGHN